ncbi:hypothetical protein DWX73_10935 [Coprococcus sp. AF21-14LB]|nr:DUF6465 family protein [Coprococcus sp. AF21-14LB]RGS77111.1 hypothetical protein DWX73_10935 [Coprococcus sp. AF21-14LB]
MATRRAMKKQEKKNAGMTDRNETAVKEEKIVEEAVAEEVKAEATEEPKEETKAAEAKKEPAKRGRKPGSTKKEIKTRIMIQHQGKEIDSKDLIAAVKKNGQKVKIRSAI